MRRSTYIGAPRFVRLLWIAAQLLRHDSVSIADYQRRFDMSAYTFRYELRIVHEAGRTFRFYLPVWKLDDLPVDHGAAVA